MKRTQTVKTPSNSIRAKLLSTKTTEQLDEQASVKALPVPKKKVVSFRVTEEQHASLVARCNNSYGETLMSPSEYVRYTVLYQRVAQPSDVPLERYRLAIAAQIAVAVTDMVQYLDQEAPGSLEKHMHGFQNVCNGLAKIQDSILLLLNADKLK